MAEDVRAILAAIERVDAKVDSLDVKIQGVDERLSARIDSVLQTLVDVKESLEREMAQGFAAVSARFDAQDARLARHGALLQSGSRWSTKMNDWAEKVDSAFAVRDRQFADLSERVTRLERRSD